MGAKHKLTDATKAAIDTAKALTTADGWQSFMTNMGVPGKDKGASVRFKARNRLDVGTIDAVYRQDGLAATIVDDIVNEAFRCGWRLTFPSPVGSEVATTYKGASPDQDDRQPTISDQALGSGKTEPVPAQLVASINQRLTEWHKQTSFLDRSKEHFKQSRYAGSAVMVLGAEDGRDPSEPLDTNAKGLTFNWMRSLDRFQVSPSGSLVDDPASRWYGLPVWYMTTSTVMGGASSSSLPPGGVAELDDVSPATGQETAVAAFSLNSTNVHTSRIWRTDATKLSERARLHNGGWGESVLDRTWDALSHYNSAMAGVGTIIQDFTQGVYAIEGLKELLASEKSGLIRKRYSIMDQTKSVVNALIVDAEKESYTRQSTTVTGLPELIDRSMLWMTAVSGSPMTRLFGVSPGGFGTGEAEGQNWQTRVGAWQGEDLRPFLEHVYGLLFQTKDFADVPDGWQIDFNPLQVETPDQISDRRMKNAQSDAIYMLQGAVSPREVAHSRFAGSKYGEDIALDLDTRQRLEAQGPAGEGPPETAAEATAANLNAAAEATAQAKDTVKPTGREIGSAVGMSAIEAGGEPGTLEAPAAPGGNADTAASVGVGAEDVAKTALNGAQVNSLRELMADAVAGTPLESVVGVAMFSFPTMTRDEALAMFKPAVDKAVSAPKPAPPVAPPPIPPANPELGEANPELNKP